jgi:hypothetical protein
VRAPKKTPVRSIKSQADRGHKHGVVGYSRKTALLEEAITQMNAGKYGRSSAALKELLALDPQNMEARRLFATLHLRLGSLIPARQAFDSLINEAFERQDYWLAESLLREYLTAGPRCVPYLEKLGSIYQEKGDALEAVAEYGKAIDILIEDPDPANPHHSSQLYAKIRELAPASPVAFRLASFFDAQTGELLTRQASDAMEPAVVPSSDAMEENQGLQASPEPVKEVMPWEVQNSSEAVGISPAAADFTDAQPAPNPQATTDIPAYEGQSFDDRLLAPDLLVPHETESRIGEVQTPVPEDNHAHEFSAVPSQSELRRFSGQIGSTNSLSSTSPEDSVTEVLTAQPEPDPVVSVGNPAVPQEQNRLLGDIQQEPVSDAVERAGAPASTDSADVQESPVGESDPVAVVDVMRLSQDEGGSISTLLEGEPVTIDPIQAQPSESFPLQLVNTDAHELILEKPVDPSDSPIPTETSTDQNSEIWKQPNSSWESVFDKGEEIGAHQSTNLSQPEPRPTQVLETAADSPQGSLLQEHQAEDRSIEIPERKDQPLFKDETASGSAIAPMPWDQVEESSIAIHPAQPDQPVTESVEPAADQAVLPDESDRALETDDGQTQLLASPESPVTEADSLLTIQASEPEPAPFSSELDVLAPEVGPASLAIEQDSSSEEPEQQFTIASSPMVAEPLMPETLVVEIGPLQGSMDGPIEPVVETPAKVLPEIVDSFLPTDDDSVLTPPQNLVQEPAAAPFTASVQPSGEMLGEKTDAALSLPVVQTQPKIWDPPPEDPEISHVTGEAFRSQADDPEPQEVSAVDAKSHIPEPVSQKEEWVKAGESIRFVEQPQAAPVEQVPPTKSEREDASRSVSVAASAVGVLFESSRNVLKTEVRERAAEPKPIRKLPSAMTKVHSAVAGFVSSCFSTTRAIVTTLVGLVVFLGVVVALGIGAIALTWIGMEEPPSAAFQSLTTTPQRTLSDFKKNGYLLLLGMSTPADQDPIRAGYDQKPEVKDADLALGCFGSSGSGAAEGSNASAHVMRGWFRGSDPIGQFKSHQEAIKGWRGQHQLALDRYSQWQKLPFEDWGYGQTISPPCAAMVFAHQLHVADGFVQGADIGIDRLETDIEAWRIVLSQAKTLPMKMLALQALNDDIAVASGVLVRSDFDGKYLERVTTFLRPLDQAELSIRWAMQSELVSASKTYDAQLKAEREREGEGEQAVSAMVASALPLPKQRRLNDYAEYYEASYKASGGGQYGSLPKWKDYVQFPASGLMDYFTNPIENIVGLAPLVHWDLYNGLVVDADAHLRLASLQAWLRRGAGNADLVTRLAQAGQNLYDPYTGLPMLVNQKKRVLYSVGHDGKDQDADPQVDVVVEIPLAQAPAVPAKPSAGSSKSK